MGESPFKRAAALSVADYWRVVEREWQQRLLNDLRTPCAFSSAGWRSVGEGFGQWWDPPEAPAPLCGDECPCAECQA